MESKLTRRARTDIVIIFTALIVAGTLGYFEGKHNADRWYAQHRPIASTPQMNDMCADGDSLWGPPVKLIPPQKVKAKSPVASLETPSGKVVLRRGWTELTRCPYSFLRDADGCRHVPEDSIPLSMRRELWPEHLAAPVASVEEPR